MAQVDVKWPSEDEEFDATADGSGTPPEDSAATVAVTDAKDEASPETVFSPTSTAPEVETSEPAADTDAGTEEATGSESGTETAEATPEAPEETPAEAETADAAPEPPSEPETSTEPQPVPETTSNDEKPQQPPTVGTGIHHTGRTILIGALILIIAGLGLYAWTLHSDKNNLQKQVNQLKADPNAEIDRQVKALVAKVSKLVSLPTTETPRIQTVTDANTARKQSAFYDKAKNGDKVLLYVNSRKAIIYRPSTNKVIVEAPIQIDTSGTVSNSSTTSSASTPKSAKSSTSLQ
jgi:hypothetical protein